MYLIMDYYFLQHDEDHVITMYVMIMYYIKPNFVIFCIINSPYDAFSSALLLRQTKTVELHLVKSTVKLSYFLIDTYLIWLKPFKCTN